MSRKPNEPPNAAVILDHYCYDRDAGCLRRISDSKLMDQQPYLRIGDKSYKHCALVYKIMTGINCTDLNYRDGNRLNFEIENLTEQPKSEVIDCFTI